MVLNKILSTIKQIRDLEPQIFLDYDGTLVPIINDPEKSYADSELFYILDYLFRKYETFIVTGRSLGETRRFLGDYNIIALHGGIYYINGTVIEVHNYKKYVNVCNNIYDNRAEFLKEFSNLRVYNKNGGVLFHMGNIKNLDEREKLLKKVKYLGKSVNMDIYMGKDILELRIPCINKGEAIKRIRNTSRPAIIIGDDITDEEAFMENADAITIKVGNETTVAKYSINFELVRELLIDIINIK